jgi:hypothetical protein
MTHRTHRDTSRDRRLKCHEVSEVSTGPHLKMQAPEPSRSARAAGISRPGARCSSYQPQVVRKSVVSRWSDLFAELSRDVDTSDSSRHIGKVAYEVSRSVRCVAASSTQKDEPETATPEIQESNFDHSSEHPETAAIVAPVQWFANPDAELGYEEPCAARRGVIRQRGPMFEHFCEACGDWGAFGYGHLNGAAGHWYCRQHRPELRGVP